MASLRPIVDELFRCAAAEESSVLATVVRVVGSSYGGAGARMLVRVDGATVGLVSGGCLESDLAEHARDVQRRGAARVVTYDARADDDAVWGLGLGCNGMIDVLLEPLSPARAGALAHLFGGAIRGDRPATIATVVASTDAARVGTRWMVAPDEPHAMATLAAGRRGLVREVAGETVAFETVVPVVHLVVCGSGPDAVPVARLGVQLGWDVTVVDHRPVGQARAERFPGARVVECRDPLRLADAVALTPRAAVVVMSHHFARDTMYLEALLAAPVRYVGLLGPASRTTRMLAEIALRGAVAISDAPSHAMASADRPLHGPVGLDLGGEGPEAIALAIVAEVSAVMHARSAGHLRDGVATREAAAGRTAGGR